MYLKHRYIYTLKNAEFFCQNAKKFCAKLDSDFCNWWQKMGC